MQLLNSPLEVGVRVVALLSALYPAGADLTRIVLLDHLILHSGDFSEEMSLHPKVPGRVGELGVKRQLVSEGISLMGARGLIVPEYSVAGIAYVAGDDARPFLSSINSLYLADLQRRCEWAAREFSAVDDDAIRSRLGDVFGHWAVEFEQIVRQDNDE